MRKIKEIFRLKWTTHLSNRDIAKSCLTSRSTVAGCLERASKAGLSWLLPESLDETALEHLIYPPVVVSEAVRAVPAWSLVQKELQNPGQIYYLLMNDK